MTASYGFGMLLVGIIVIAIICAVGLHIINK